MKENKVVPFDVANKWEEAQMPTVRSLSEGQAALTGKDSQGDERHKQIT